MNRKSLITRLAIYGLLAVITFGILIWRNNAPVRAQLRNMRAAEDHIPTIRPFLAKDPRFARIEMDSNTINGGSLLIRGELESYEAEAELKSVVSASGPPVHVEYRVEVMTPDMKRMVEEYRKRQETDAGATPVQ